MSKTRSELNENLSAIKRLQTELNRREEEGAEDILENLKTSIAILEKENATLKVIYNVISWNIIENTLYHCSNFFDFTTL